MASERLEEAASATTTIYRFSASASLSAAKPGTRSPSAAPNGAGDSVVVCRSDQVVGPNNLLVCTLPCLPLAWGR